MGNVSLRGRAGVAEEGHESVGTITLFWYGSGSPLLLRRDLLSSFEDQPKPLVRKPPRGRFLAFRFRILPVPGQGQVPPEGLKDAHHSFSRS